MARDLAAKRATLPRSVLFISFGAEELGTLGALHFTKNPTVPWDAVVAMFNLDMVGRLRESKLDVQGVGTSPGVEGSRRVLQRRGEAQARPPRRRLRPLGPLAVLRGEKARPLRLHGRARRLPQALRHGRPHRRRGHRPRREVHGADRRLRRVRARAHRLRRGEGRGAGGRRLAQLPRLGGRHPRLLGKRGRA